MITIINENLRIERRIIGTIDFMEIITEQKVEDNKLFPVFKNSFKGKCVIEVYGKEGSNMPHFHITSVDKKFSCCICIFDNRFFNHGKHKGLLHKKDWKILDEWMRQKNSKYPNITNWEYTKQIWEDYNDKTYKNNDVELDYDNQPDYTTIKSYKGE